MARESFRVFVLFIVMSLNSKKKAVTPKKFGLQKDENIEAVITLFGNSNTGKTAALRYLYYLLGGRTLHGGSQVNFRIKFEYNDKVIALSTVGDTEHEVEVNWACFREKTYLNTDEDKLGYEIETDKQSPCIVVSPTHLNDMGMRVQEQNIAALRKDLIFEAKYSKQEGKPNIRIQSQIDPALASEEIRRFILGEKLYDKMKGSANSDDLFYNAAYTANVIKEQIDRIL